MGRPSVLLQLDMPSFIDNHRRPDLSWMETEEKGIWRVRGGWGEGIEGDDGEEAEARM